MSPPPALDDLARRRSSAQRLAWLLGTCVVALYVIGLFIQR
jgi:hypothetical protein